MAFGIVNMMINKVPYPRYRYGTLLRCYIHMLAIKLLSFFECQAVSMPSTEVLLIGLVIILLFLQLLSLFIFKWRNRSKRREGIAPSPGGESDGRMIRRDIPQVSCKEFQFIIIHQLLRVNFIL